MKTALSILLLASSALLAQEPTPSQPLPPADLPLAAVPESPVAPEKKPVELGNELAIPEAYREDRYESTFTKNPFLVKTTPVQQAQASFAEDWELNGFIGRGDKQTALIHNKKTAAYKRVTSEPDDEGFRLVKASPSRDRKDTSAEIAKGAETATLKFAETAAAPTPGITGRQPMPGQPMPGQQPRPGYPTPNNGVTAGMPTAPGSARPGMPNTNRPVTPTNSPNPGAYPNGNPGIRGFPGNANPGVQNQGGVVPNAPNPVSRRRVRIPTPTPPGHAVP